MEWIKCSDRLPYVDAPVIFFAVNNLVLCGRYHGISGGNHKVWESDDCVFWDNEVTRWMPLPEPPGVKP